MDPTTNPAPVTPSIVRTVVPFVVGWVVTLLASRGINMDDQMQTMLGSGVALVVGAVYYTVVRFLEQSWPQFGWLLGLAKTPTYDTSGVESDLATAQAQAQSFAAEVAALEEQVKTFQVAAAAAPAKKAPAKKAPAKKAAPRGNA